MNREIDKFLEDKKIIKNIASDIIEILEKDIVKDNIDYSFDITKGTGKLKSREPNTSFFFDSRCNTSLENFKKALFSEDLQDIAQESEEEKQLMKKVREFLKIIAAEINLNYKEKLQDVIRKNILPSSKKEDIPLDEITIISIDVADFSSIPEPAKYMLKIGKFADSPLETGKITQFVHKEQEETDKTVEEIFNKEKDINPLFKNVASLEIGRKFLYDITIVLFIDYSLSKLPQNPNI